MTSWSRLASLAASATTPGCSPRRPFHNQRRQGHRPFQLPLPELRHQPGLARRRPPGRRVPRLDQEAVPGRGSRPGRAQAPALRAAPHRRGGRPFCTTHHAAPCGGLAVGHRARGRLRPTAVLATRHLSDYSARSKPHGSPVVDHAHRTARRPADALIGDRHRLTAPAPRPAHRRTVP